MNAPQHILKCSSHRARKRLLGILAGAGMKPQAYWSFDRSTPYGAYEIPTEMLTRARMIKGTSLLRAPYDDMRPCW